jgi:hypothetical protein
MGVYIKSRFSYDPDALAFIQASSIPQTSQKLAINQLVLDLKAYGIWGKMKAIYPMVGGSAFYHKWNLKDPRDLDAAFRLNFVGGWTHSSTGALPNGTNAYANTFLNPALILGINNKHISSYVRTNIAGCLIGCNDTLNNRGDVIWRLGLNNYYNLSAPLTTVASTATNGFYLSYRNISTNSKYLISSNPIQTITQNSSGNTNQILYIGVRNDGGSVFSYSNSQCAFSSIGDGLTDTEAANFYTAVQAFQITLGRSIGTQTVSDADAQAFINAAVIQDQVEATAVNQLVIDMKGYGLWSKMKAVYPFVGGTAASHKWNLKNPLDTNAAFRLSFVGGWTHSATGALPNGTNGYADTFLSPSTSLTNNNTHISYYSRTNTSGPNKGLIGCSTGGSSLPLFTIYGRTGSNVFFMDSYNYNTNRNQGAEPTGQSFLLSTRISSSSFKSFRNNSLVASGVNTNADNVTNINFPISIGGLNLNGTVSQFSDFQCAFSSIGDGLSDTEAANLYLCVQNFNTTLNRQI